MSKRSPPLWESDMLGEGWRWGVRRGDCGDWKRQDGDGCFRQRYDLARLGNSRTKGRFYPCPPVSPGRAAGIINRDITMRQGNPLGYVRGPPLTLFFASTGDRGRYERRKKERTGGAVRKFGAPPARALIVIDPPPPLRGIRPRSVRGWLPLHPPGAAGPRPSAAA